MANISTLGQALDQIARIKTQQSQLDQLTAQLATGKKTNRFAGLGNDVLTSQRARADLSSLDVYLTNIKNADRRINLMTSSLENIGDQASIIEDSLATAIQQGDYPDLETIQQTARNILAMIESNINIQDGERYLFAGSDSSSKPYENTGLFESFLGEYVPDETDLTNPPLTASGLIGQWGDGTITTDEFIQSYHNVNETVMGYSNSLSTDSAGHVFSRVDENTELDYTYLADSDPIKDIVTALNVLISLPPPEYAPGALNDPTATTFGADTPPFPPEEKQDNFFAVINDIANTLNSASNQLEQETYGLTLVQSQMQQIQEDYDVDKNTLLNIIGEVEDVDLTEAATQIQQLQIQLEASYSVTALVSQLSIVNYLL